MAEEDVLPQYLDTQRSRSFGTVADQYDRTRPTYPEAMVADLLAPGPVDIVDVGCGTGKAGRLFIGDGRRVLGVEPDPRMAAVARTHGLDVEVGVFEEWDPGDRRFDLLVSGQAWHWVEPVAGAAKAAEVLRSGAVFAVFSNEINHTPEVRATFEAVYPRYVPAMLETSFVLGVIDTITATNDSAGQALTNGPFHDTVPGQRRPYYWSEEYTPAAWVDLVGTYSDHRALDPAVLQPLLAEVQAALSELGPRFTVTFRTDLLRAVRD